MISPDDLVLYALGDLSPAERAAIDVQLAASEQDREELARIQAGLASFALSTSELRTPPLLARERLLRQVSKEKKLAPVQPAEPAYEEPVLRAREARTSPPARVLSIQEDTPTRRSPGFTFFAWAGWAVAAGLATLAVFQYHRHESLQQAYVTQTAKLDDAGREAERAQRVMELLQNGGAMQVTLHQVETSKEPPKPFAHAAYASDTGQLVFVAMHMPQLELYKTYELWVIPADGKPPIPAGLFKPNQQGFASVVLPELPKGVVAGKLGVSIENDGGSPAPTDVILLGA